MEAAPDDKLDEDGNNLPIQVSKIFSQLECEYIASTLKKKLDQKDEEVEWQPLNEIYFIALRTVGALMKLLMLNTMWKKLEKIYRQQ